MNDAAHTPLLASSDPAPVDMINLDASGPVLLVCEHAGNATPAALGDLGVSLDVLRSHRGWDIGAEDVAIRLAAELDAPLIVQRYSRLVIDANRPPRTAESIPAVSDGVAVPANQELSPQDVEARVAEIFDPFDRELGRASAQPGRRALFSIHSFTPRLGGEDRPWRAGFLSRASQATARRLLEAVARARPDLELALNAPYRIEDATDWFIPVYAEPSGLPHALIEIRNDQIDHAAGAALWADLLAAAIRDVLRSLP